MSASQKQNALKGFLISIQSSVNTTYEVVGKRLWYLRNTLFLPYTYRNDNFFKTVYKLQNRNITRKLNFLLESEIIKGVS